MKQTILPILVGGGIGAISRFAISGFTHKFIGTSIKGLGVFPWGTLAVNWLGAFVMGFLWAMFEKYSVSTFSRSFFIIGFLGSFTTFSTYSLETFQLLRNGEMKLALLNITCNNLGSISLLFIGYFLFRIIFK